ncbi:MAG TPA: hypothetical protein VKX17_28420 [Planctomycetota bacterium]|nr:hypothetical protein [Planctomycetota bacterium]
MPFEELEIRHAAVSAKIAPARGALISALNVDGRDVLFLDRSTFDDPAKNVRGGIPVLFPYAGKLENETFFPVLQPRTHERRATSGGTKMKQHGFGRNKAWRVIGARADTLRVELSADDETRAVFPFEFHAVHSCTILPRGLLIALSIENRDRRGLPVSPGWHPYFNCAAARKAEVTCDSPRFLPGSTTDTSEFDFGIAAPVDGRVSAKIPELGTVELSFSPEMRHLQFWSQPGKDFVCIEPFTGPNNTINTERRVEIPPGACRVFWTRIELV